MENQLTDKMIEQEYSNGDQSIEVLNIEMKLYFSNSPFFIIKRVRKDIYLTDTRDNTLYYLRGDNLVTKKMIAMRFLSKEEYKKKIIENDIHLYSFVLMPHIVGKGRCQLNSKRATVKGYNDNPFVFYNSLKSLYLSDFEKELPDPVEKLIIDNLSFFKLFGCGEEGYKNYLKTFCLKSIEEVMNSKQFDSKKYFMKCNNLREWNQKDLNEYIEILNIFKDKRMVEMKMRVSELSSLNK